jgi:hypothetical protein
MVDSIHLAIALFSLIKIRRGGKLLFSSGYVVSLVFSILGIFSFPIWQSVRESAGVGLLNSIKLLPPQVDSLKLILMAIGLGALIGNLTHDVFHKGTSMKHELSKEVIKFGSWQVISCTFILIVIAFIGEGPNIFRRDQYLEANGVLFFQKVAGALLLPSLALATFTAIRIRRGYQKIFLISLLLLSFSFYIGKGSRVSMIIVGLLWFVAINSNLTKKFKAIYSILSIVILYFIVGIILQTRQTKHGIFEVPTLLQNLLGESFNIFYFSYLVALGFSWVVVVPLSIGTIDGSRLLQNLNPMINSGLNPYDFSSTGAERLYPYRWVPASTAGQIYQVIGFVGIVFVFFILTLCLLAALRLQSSRKITASMQYLVLSLYIFQFPIFIQYSSRNWFRVVWLFFLTYALIQFLRQSPTNRYNKVIT